MEARVIGEELRERAVGPRDVGRVAGKRRQAERSLALAEQRADVVGHEAGDVEGVLDAGLAARGRGCCCRSRT